MARQPIRTACGSFTQTDLKKHIAACASCWVEAQGLTGLTFDPSTIHNPRVESDQETICVACNKINFVDAGLDIKAASCIDCKRTGTLMLRKEFLELSINQIESLHSKFNEPKVKPFIRRPN